MLTGTSNFDDVMDFYCPACSGYYKADEPENHHCAPQYATCDMCGKEAMLGKAGVKYAEYECINGHLFSMKIESVGGAG